MNRRNSHAFTRFSLLPEQLVDEVHDAQTALAVAEHYIRSSSQKITPYTAYRFFATHDALHEARKAIDRVIEMLRAEAARLLQHDDPQPDLPTDGI
jgi:transcriptional regulator GlxA family with amidase domain